MFIPFAIPVAQLFPYHFAQNSRVFEALTPPPVEPRALVLTLARSLANEQEKIQFLEIFRTNGLPLDIMFADDRKDTAISIAAQRRENRFAQICAETLIRLIRIF